MQKKANRLSVVLPKPKKKSEMLIPERRDLKFGLDPEKSRFIADFRERRL